MHNTRPEAIGVITIARWLLARVSTVKSRDMSSWSVPKAAIEPKNPLATAIHRIFGSRKNALEKPGEPQDGPQSQIFSLPPADAVCRSSNHPPGRRHTMYPIVRRPATM